MMFSFSKRINKYNESDIKTNIITEELITKPDFEEEINLISFEEAMSISNKHEKRSLILNVLKNDIVKHTPFIKSALYDSDSETTHYAASATVEVYKKLKKKIQEQETALSIYDKNIELSLALMSTIVEYISSGVLTDKDMKVYLKKYTTLMETSLNNHETALTEEDYLNYINFLFMLGDIENSIYYALIAKEKFPTEDSYLKLMEIYYKTKDKDAFYYTFNELKTSKIVLSNRGLEFIRFWGSR